MRVEDRVSIFTFYCWGKSWRTSERGNCLAPCRSNTDSVLRRSDVDSVAHINAIRCRWRDVRTSEQLCVSCPLLFDSNVITAASKHTLRPCTLGQATSLHCWSVHVVSALRTTDRRLYSVHTML